MGRSCRCLDAPAHPGPEPPQGWQSRPRQSKLRVPIGAVSSAVEHCLPTARVTNSNLVPPTIGCPKPPLRRLFLFRGIAQQRHFPAPARPCLLCSPVIICALDRQCTLLYTSH